MGKQLFDPYMAAATRVIRNVNKSLFYRSCFNSLDGNAASDCTELSKQLLSVQKMSEQHLSV